MDNKQKVGLTPINWILCILGIIFFSLFIILPPMFRAFIDEEQSNIKVQENGNQSSTVVNTVVCTKSDTSNEEYIIVEDNRQVKVIAYTKTIEYSGIDGIPNCSEIEENSTAKEGLYNSCEVNDNKKIITTRLTLDDYKDDISPFEFEIGLSKGEIISKLTSTNFVCDEKTSNK